MTRRIAHPYWTVTVIEAVALDNTCGSSNSYGVSSKVVLQSSMENIQ